MYMNEREPPSYGTSLRCPVPDDLLYKCSLAFLKYSRAFK